MKILIDLPDSAITEDVLRSGWESDSVFDRCIKNACKNAVILPEGHGRLMDETISLNQIIEPLIQWCVDNEYLVDIQVGTAFPSYAVFITLKKGQFKYTHEFYMAGGVFCIDRWRDLPRELEIAAFLKAAKEQFDKAQAGAV